MIFTACKAFISDFYRFKSAPFRYILELAAAETLQKSVLFT